MSKVLQFGKLAILMVLTEVAMSAMPLSGWPYYCADDEQHCTECCDLWAACCESLGGTADKEACDWAPPLCYGASCSKYMDAEICGEIVQ
jgi:hypothetical protein